MVAGRGTQETFAPMRERRSRRAPLFVAEFPVRSMMPDAMNYMGCQLVYLAQEQEEDEDRTDDWHRYSCFDSNPGRGGSTGLLWTVQLRLSYRDRKGGYVGYSTAVCAVET